MVAKISLTYDKLSLQYHVGRINTKFIVKQSGGKSVRHEHTIQATLLPCQAMYFDQYSPVVIRP